MIEQSSFHIPRPLIDLNTLPAPLLTSEPGSFAYNTFKVRIPGIIDDIVAQNAFPGPIDRAMAALKAQITDGVVEPLRGPAPDVPFWLELAEPYLGRSWLDLPWYWAEAYFYRLVLEATRYFVPGPWLGVDPYRTIKRKEWRPNAAPAAARRVLETAPAGPRERFAHLVYSSLWGNRTDLSYNVAAQLGVSGAEPHDHANLLVDDTARVWQYLGRLASPRLVIIHDNAGTELMMDLLLVDFLLSQWPQATVTLHVKPQPFFVSDAMAADVMMAIDTLRQSPPPLDAVGERLRERLRSDRLLVDTHWFYATALHYFQLPADLCARLADADLVILKGDVNYRRLLGDAHWPTTASFAEAVAYFPAPLVALRTLKAELIVGLNPGDAERLSAEDAEWMFNGRRGVVQARLTEDGAPE